jgi:hypothetical protein
LKEGQKAFLLISDRLQLLLLVPKQIVRLKVKQHA